MQEDGLRAECVGSVTTLLLAETKESERMDTSSKQQRTYEESKRESRKRNGKSKELETGNWKSLNWESLKLETGKFLSVFVITSEKYFLTT